MPTLIDHLFLFFLVVLFPLFNWNETRKVKRSIANGADPREFDTAADYRRGIAILWAICVAGVAIWLVQDRSWEALGMGVGTETAWRWAAGIAVAVVGLWLTHVQAAQVHANGDARKAFFDQLGDLMFFLPKTPRQFYWFKWLSFTAGVCEEILFRGFLIWYIAVYFGMLPAVLLSAVLFGFAHSYQGFGNAIQTAVIGLWMAILFWLTGSVWIPMITHALVDVIGGRMIYGVLSGGTPPPSGPELDTAPGANA